MPSDFLFPPLEDAEKTIGKSGHMQGAKIVTNPARNEKIRRVSTYPLSKTVNVNSTGTYPKLL